MAVVKAQEPTFLVAYGYMMIGYNQVELRLIKRGLVTSLQLEKDIFVPGTVETLKLITLDNPTKFVLVLKRHGQNYIQLYQISIEEDRLSASLMTSIPNATTLTYCIPSTQEIRLFYSDKTKVEPVLRALLLNRRDATVTQVNKPFSLGALRIRNIASTESYKLSTDFCSVAVDFEGQTLSELTFDGALTYFNQSYFEKETWTTDLFDPSSQHKSLRNTTSNDPLSTLLINSDYIMLTSASLWENYLSAPDLVSLVVYNRAKNESGQVSKYVYASLPLENVNAIILDQTNNSRLLLSSADSNYANTSPVILLEIQPML